MMMQFFSNPQPKFSLIWPQTLRATVCLASSLANKLVRLANNEASLFAVCVHLTLAGLVCLSLSLVGDR